MPLIYSLDRHLVRILVKITKMIGLMGVGGGVLTPIFLLVYTPGCEGQVYQVSLLYILDTIGHKFIKVFDTASFEI